MLSEGAGEFECSIGPEQVTVHTYRPASYHDGPLLVVCHGIKRDAAEYRNIAVRLAERFGMIVAAPLFDRERFPVWRYQQGGIVKPCGSEVPSEEWTLAFIPKIVQQIRASVGRPSLPFYLIGHSAGGQFLIRLAAFLPTDAIRIVVANPSSLVFPTLDHNFAYGFGNLSPQLSNESVIRNYLSAPITLYLGTGDTKPTSFLNTSEAAMRQGPHRLARGRACFAAAKALAAERGWKFGWLKVEVPGVGHDASRMFSAADVEIALFGVALSGEQSG